MDDVPDDDQYDTEDSFIDDAELVSFYHCYSLFSYFDGSIMAMLVLWFCLFTVFITCSTCNAPLEQL
jgi:hypothetical protein